MKIVSYNNPKSPISEAYRNIRTNIEFSNLDEDLKTIVVTSSKQNEGKSTVIANLAASFANLDNKKVLIIDGDLRNPTVHRMFGVSNVFGLTDILTGGKEFIECIHKSKIDGLHVITGGKIPPNPSEMLASKKMRNFINDINKYYDYIFIDAPPIGIVTDAGIISSFCDGTILVVGSKESDIEAVKISKDRLDKINANILGVVLNKYEAEGSAYGYYSYYYGHEEVSHKSKGRRNKKAKLKVQV